MSAAITAEEINAYLAEAFPISGQRCIDVGERWALDIHAGGNGIRALDDAE